MRLILMSFFCFVLISLKAQDQSYKFDSYSLEDGLSQSTVYSFLEDDLGYIWIATRDGLNRFDATNFVSFYPSEEDSNSLSYRSVRALTKDNDGFIWVGTDGGGVDRLDPKTNKFENICELLTKSNCEIDTNITSLEIVDSRLLIGTRNVGLFEYDLINNALYKTLESRSTIWDISVHQNKIFLATSDGLTIIDPLDTSYLFKDLEIRTLKILSNNRILLGTRSSGLLVFDLLSEEVDQFSTSIVANEISSLEIDSENDLWIATDNNGIFISNLRGEVKQHIRSSNQLPNQLQSNSIRMLYGDSNGVVWVGTNNAGFSNYSKDKYQFKSYSSLSTEGALPTDIILSFSSLDDGNMIIGTEQKGLILFDSKNNSFEPLNLTKGKNIIAIEKDNNGQLWVATDGSGLLKFSDQRRLSNFKEIKNLTNKSILSLEIINSRAVLAGSYKGLNIIEDDSTVTMNFAPVYLQEDRILAIESLGDNSFLLGTFSNGVVLFDRNKKSFRKFDSNTANSSKNKPPERVQSIYIDSTGRIWLGSYSGLYLFERESELFKAYTIKDGLPNDVVYGILEDLEGNLWLSTNFGISKFNPKVEKFTNYTISDGLLSNEFNGGAYFKDSNGLMYFGGVKGFIQFDPSLIGETYLPGNIIIYSMNVDGELFNPLLENYIELKNHQDYIEFEFSYLNFVNSDKYIFEYQLSGLSDNWIQIDKRRSIKFSGLRPSNYSLLIRATNNFNDVIEYSEPIYFTIKPPFWTQSYFIISIMVLLIGIMYALFRYRMFYSLKEEKTRNRIARDLHDDLSATLSSISFFSEAAKRQQKGSISNSVYLQRIDESALEAKEKINDIIWAIDPENDDWNAFITKCKRYAAEMFESKGIEYEIDVDEAVLIISDPGIRHDLWLIFKEIVTNIIRHSNASNAKISINKKSHKLVLSIQDDGVGIKEEDLNKGNGIVNLKHRAKTLNASLVYNGLKEKGTKWEISIPL